MLECQLKVEEDMGYSQELNIRISHRKNYHRLVWKLIYVIFIKLNLHRYIGKIYKNFKNLTFSFTVDKS